MLRLFGAVGWTVDGEPHVVSGRRRQLVLGVLMLNAPHPVALSRLASLVQAPSRMTGEPDGTNVYLHVHRLRRALRQTAPTLADRLLTVEHGYALDVAADRIDVGVFRHLCAVARDLETTGSHADARDAAWVALRSWQGLPFGALHDDVRGWPEVRALHDAVRQVTQIWARRQRRTGDGVRAAQAARHLAIGRPGLEPLAAAAAALMSSDAQETPLVGPKASVLTRSVLDALDRSARHAAESGAPQVAAEGLRALLNTVDASDPRRPYLLLRLGRAMYETDGGGQLEVEEALRSLARGRDQSAVVAGELLLCRIAWVRGSRTTSQHLQRAQAALHRMPADSWIEEDIAGLCNLLAASAVADEAITLAQRAIRARPTVTPADRWDRARLIGGRALARLHVGDERVVDDLQEAARLHDLARGWIPTSCWVNTVDMWIRLGKLRRAHAASSAAITARHVHSRLDKWATDVDAAWLRFWAGRTTGTLAGLRPPSGSSPHYLVASHLGLAARVATIDGDHVRAERMALRALEASDGVPATDVRFTALTIAAGARLRQGAPPAAIEALVEEALDCCRGAFIPGQPGIELPLAMRALGMGPRVLDQFPETPWTSAARLVVTGQAAEAAGVYQRIGSAPDAMLAGIHHG